MFLTYILWDSTSVTPISEGGTTSQSMHYLTKSQSNREYMFHLPYISRKFVHACD